MATGKLPDGYTLRALDVHGEELVPGAALNEPFIIEVYQGDERAGYAEVYHHGSTSLLMVSNVFVFPDHRRHGLASAMYVFAEQLAGKPLHPYPKQKAKGKLLWKQPERPFGR